MTVAGPSSDGPSSDGASFDGPALDGRGAVVTGGASGIGRATCRRLAAAGARVAVLDADAEGAARVADEVAGRSWAVDVTDGEGLRDAVDQAADAFGGLAVLVNNAGTAGAMAPLAQWDPAEWERLVAVNLTGIFHGMRAAVPHLLRPRQAAVVNTSPRSARRGPAAGETPYAAAKAGVMALTASAALEYGGRIRVNAVAPGMIRTNMTRVLLEGFPSTRWPATKRAPHPSWAGWVSRRTWPTWWHSSVPTRRASSRARRSS